MNPDQRNLYTIIYVAIFSIIVTLLTINFRAYPDTWSLVSLELYWFRYILLYFGIAIICARMGFKSIQHTFIYLLTGWFNTIIFIHTFICFRLDEKLIYWLNHGLYNLFIALLILADCYILPKLNDKKEA